MSATNVSTVNLSATNISNSNLTSSNASITSITTNTIQGISSSTVNLYTNVTGAIINMGGLTLDNTINIKTVGTLALGVTAGTINIGTDMDNGAINIGNSGTTTQALNLDGNSISINNPLTIAYTALNERTYFTTMGCYRAVGFYANAGPYTSTGRFALHGSMSDLPIGLYMASHRINIYCNSTGSFKFFVEGPGNFNTPTYTAYPGENWVNISYIFYLDAVASVKQYLTIIVYSGSFSHNNTGYNCFYVRIS